MGEASLRTVCKVGLEGTGLALLLVRLTAVVLLLAVVPVMTGGCCVVASLAALIVGGEDADGDDPGCPSESMSSARSGYCGCSDRGGDWEADRDSRLPTAL